MICMKFFQNHFNVWLSLYDMIYIYNFFMIIKLYKSRKLKINLCKDYLTLISIHLAIGYKMFFVYNFKAIHTKSLVRVNYGRVYRPRSIVRSCELARIFDIGMRYLNKVMQSKWHSGMNSLLYNLCDFSKGFYWMSAYQFVMNVDFKRSNINDLNCFVESVAPLSILIL